MRDLTLLTAFLLLVFSFIHQTKCGNNNHKHYTTQIKEELPRHTKIVDIGKLADKWFNTNTNTNSESNNDNKDNKQLSETGEEKQSNNKPRPYKFKFFNCERVCAMFQIDPDTGVVSVARRLDRDNLCHVASTCCPHRRGSNQCLLDLTIRSDDDFSHIIVLVLDIQDINDNSPYWFQSELTLMFSEGSEVGETKSLEVARDSDSGINGVKTYRMDPVIDKFNLDFTVTNAEFSSRDIGTGDGGGGSMGSGGRGRGRGGAGQGTVYNEDYDGGRQQLRLVLRKKLDREEQDRYEFTLTAIDGGNRARNGSVKVVITVSDENDNSPIFEKPHYSVTVNENLHVHTPVIQVRAVDKDSEMNGKIEYRISSLTKSEFSRLFRIETNSGIIRVQQELNYESFSSVTLIIEATDMGNLPRVTTCTVSVTINDLNDNPPEIYFEPPRIMKNSNIVENDVPGKLFAVFSVQDKDSNENGKVNCHLDPIENEYFSLDRMKIPLTIMYKIMTIKSFDREKSPRLEAKVVCWDEGIPRLSTRGSMVVEVEDRNDEVPTFTRSSYLFQVEESVRPGSYLFTVNATDKDEGKNAVITYTIYGEDSDKFSINSGDGRIFLESGIDRELKEYLQFSVKAEDSGFPRQASTTNVSVHVLDVNDNTPFLQETLHLFVYENHSLVLPITVLNATDIDSGFNAQIVMQIQSEIARTTVRGGHDGITRFDYSSDPSLLLSNIIYKNVFKSERESNFVILPDGKLMLREEALDREQAARHELTVVVRDRGNPPLSSTSTLVVSVSDVNDWRPQFIFPSRLNSTVSIMKGSVTGTTITQVTAIDLDEGLNGKVKYSFKSNHHTNKLFLMHPESGKITLQQTLNEVEINNFILIIMAKDCGIPPFEDTARLQIRVIPKITATDANEYNLNQDFEENVERKIENNVVIIMALVFAGILFIVFISIATSILIYKRVNWNHAGTTRHSRGDRNQIKSNLRQWKKMFVRPFIKKQREDVSTEDYRATDSIHGQSLMQNNSDDVTAGLSRSFFLNPLSLDSMSQFYGDNKESTSTFHSLRTSVPKCINEYQYTGGNNVQGTSTQQHHPHQHHQHHHQTPHTPQLGMTGTVRKGTYPIYFSNIAHYFPSTADRTSSTFLDTTLNNQSQLPQHCDVSFHSNSNTHV